LLAACSDDGEPIGSGSGAGDDIQNQRIEEDIADLTPYTGVYDLTGNWRGDDGDAAFLIIRSPSDLGVSEVLLRDVDEFDNCSETAREGNLMVDDAGGNREIFLNELNDFDSAVASRTADGGIRLTVTDINDVDGDQDRNERVSVTGDRVGITEQDLPPDC